MGKEMHAGRHELKTSLAIDGLRHAYGSRAVLMDITLQIASGEIVCLLGRSGCGKTTLLRLIAGLERPEAGTIRIGADDVTGPASFIQPEKRGVGLVFQDYALFPHLTVVANVMFGLKDRADAAVAAEAMLARVGLSGHADRYPHTLSGGEQQRAALARALAPHPQLLLMDEPFSNLDAGTRAGVRAATLTLLRETGTTAVIVTHDPAEAMVIADRIVLLHDGRIEQIATPRMLYDRPATLYAARFCGELNEIPGGYIRPHDILMSNVGEGVKGRVTAVEFLGEASLVTVAVDGMAAPLKVRTPASSVFAEGQEVRLTIPPERILTFPSTM